MPASMTVLNWYELTTGAFSQVINFVIFLLELLLPAPHLISGNACN